MIILLVNMLQHVHVTIIKDHCQARTVLACGLSVTIWAFGGSPWSVTACQLGLHVIIPMMMILPRSLHRCMHLGPASSVALPF